jgi:hypothetical protein
MRTWKAMSFILVLVSLAGATAHAEHLDDGTGGGVRSLVGSQRSGNLGSYVSKCLVGRPGAVGNSIGAATDGASIFNSTCLSCHGPKDRTKSIACIQGLDTCGGFPFMPPSGPLPSDQQSAIVNFLQSGG